MVPEGSTKWSLDQPVPPSRSANKVCGCSQLKCSHYYHIQPVIFFLLEPEVASPECKSCTLCVVLRMKCMHNIISLIFSNLLWLTFVILNNMNIFIYISGLSVAIFVLLMSLFGT